MGEDEEEDGREGGRVGSIKEGRKLLKQLWSLAEGSLHKGNGLFLFLSSVCRCLYALHYGFS